MSPPHISNSTKEDSFDVDLFNAGDIAISVFSSILLWICVPGCSLVYSGGGKRQSALTTLMLSFWVMAIVSLQWWAVGYSLTFSKSGGTIIGNFDNVFLYGVYGVPGPKPATSIPELAFCLYQGVTATLGPCFIFGIAADRGRLLPSLIFTLIWTTFVYDFCAYWTLNPNGWGVRLGVLDFGGGAPVHVPVGGAALAYTIMLGPTKEKNSKPHNMSNVFLGTTLLWIGSFGYNAGSAYRANMVAVMSCVNTNLSASAAAMIWALLDYCIVRKVSAFGFCLGAIVGMVSVVPASGFVSASSGVAIGVLSSLVCYIAFLFKDRFFFDDVLDVFIVNGIGGIMGNFLTGIFTQKCYGGEEVGDGGWLDGNWIQVIYQLADTGATFFLSLVVSFIALFLMNKTKWLKLRVSAEEETIGIDETEVGLNCYEFLEDMLSSEFGPNMQGDKTRKLISNGISTIDQTDSLNNDNGNNHPIRNNWLIN